MPRSRDEGSALMITMMVMLLVTALATTVLTVTTKNLSAAGRSRDYAAALDAADAGVAQALAYLRSRGTHPLRCSPTCATNPWGNRTTPATATLPGLAGQSYSVWIEPLAPFPENEPARYRVHADGRSAGAVRSLEVDVTISRSGWGAPLGVFSRTLEGGGNYTLARTSIFSTGCVYQRARLRFTAATDVAYGIPTGVHSAQTITTGNGNNTNCGATQTSIHASGSCHADFPHDQDASGGPLTSAPCEATAQDHPRYYGRHDLDGDGDVDVDGSRIADAQALRDLFGLSETPLSPTQLDDLRAVARSQANGSTSYYRRSVTGFPTPDPSRHPNAVLFFDLLGTADEGGIVDLKDLDETVWGRDPVLSADAAGCPAQSLMIVVVGGNLRLNGGESLAATIILTSPAPYGKVLRHNGSARTIGTLFADYIDVAGTAEMSLDPCFLSNLSPYLRSTTVGRYVEVDRTD